ncbi:hypothetical protein [Alkalihalobacillus sp. BA299]|uniref:hypothetical protein n=1 Tax=Alkalihalobacillus sp. BA299 TaxID=2815938 RepID=UPI001ADAF959|nr:hypothetical protein [Alkalihalobacillus sp. BA299]
MNNWVSRKVLLFIIGNVCIIISSRTFPSPKLLTFSEWLGELVFSPFSLLGAVILFIVGFMAFAFLVKATIIEVVYPYMKKRSINTSEVVVAIMMLVSFFFQVALHPLTGALAVIFAIAYGIMEANEGKVYDSDS